MCGADRSAGAGAQCITDEGGSVLMLMPAAVLVLVVLASTAVDAAIVFMAQRELQAATAAAANDAAVAALDEAVLYECGGLGVALDRAHEVAAAALAARAADTVEALGAPDIAVSSDSDAVEVTVAMRGRVDLLFRPALRGAATQEVTASSTASPRLPPGADWPSPTDC